MYAIEINNAQEYVEIDASFLREVAEGTLSEEHVARAQISIALVDNATIQELNRQYLGHDEATDVLSFLLECQSVGQSDGSSGQWPRGTGKRLEGEVILSTEMAFNTAPEFHWTPHDEVVLYLVHGLLHLLGYDDLCRGEKQMMRSRERAILKFWNLTPRYAETASDAPGSDGPLPVDRSWGVDS